MRAVDTDPRPPIRRRYDVCVKSSFLRVSRPGARFEIGHSVFIAPARFASVQPMSGVISRDPGDNCTATTDIGAEQKWVDPFPSRVATPPPL